MKNDLLNELQATSDELFALLPSFTHEQFNTVPPHGGWTAGQVCSHLSMSEAGVVETIFGHTRPTTERPHDEKVAELRAAFLNFDIKMQAPDFVLPRADTYQQEALINAFRRSRAQLKDAIERLDLSETALDFSFPVLGYMTRLELVTFALVHAIRHTRQLRNIAARVRA